jgi:biotin carboxyl carrier protein
MANSIWNIDGKNVKGSDGAVIKWDDNRYFTLTFNGHDFNGELLEENTEGNFLKLKINHRVFEIKKKGELDDLIAALGLDVPKVRKLKELPAPMPGRIVQIAINVGDEVAVGDELLSLEAMKMENVLKAEGVGVVKAIHIKQDQVVEKGFILIEFE